MAALRTVLHLGVCLSAWTINAAAENVVHTAENVQWESMDFKTILTWTQASDNPHTVKYSWGDSNWETSPDCFAVTDSECDLTPYLKPLDRTYTADIQVEGVSTDNDYHEEEPPHTYSPPFNPYRQSNISAVKFTLEPVDKNRVMVNITDPLTSIHEWGKQLTIRDVLKNDLKYKISYYKSGSTGKRDIISESSVAEVSKLDAGQSYCFMVAAFIPSREKANQLGAWSDQLCTLEDKPELSLGAWVGGVFIALTVIIVIITVTVLCCRKRNESLQTTQSSAPI